MRNNHLVTTDTDARFHKTVFGVVTKLNRSRGEITSRKKLYKFKMEAVYGSIENGMLVEVLLAKDDFVTRVERAK